MSNWLLKAFQIDWFQSAMNVESNDKPIWEINFHLKSNQGAIMRLFQITFKLPHLKFSDIHIQATTIQCHWSCLKARHTFFPSLSYKKYFKRGKKWKTPIFLFQRGFFQQYCWCFSYPFIQSFFIVKSLHKHFVEFNTTISMKALNKQMRNKW